MVRIEFRKNAAGDIVGVLAHGHAGWAQKGTDIVCAAVSATLQAMWLGLERVARIPVGSDVDPGHMELTWSSENAQLISVDMIVRTAATYLLELHCQYPAHVLIDRERIVA